LAIFGSATTNQGSILFIYNITTVTSKIIELALAGPQL